MNPSLPGMNVADHAEIETVSWYRLHVASPRTDNPLGNTEWPTYWSLCGIWSRRRRAERMRVADLWKRQLCTTCMRKAERYARTFVDQSPFEMDAESLVVLADQLREEGRDIDADLVMLHAFRLTRGMQ